ncbi:hypothetical protein EDB84DRAFT_1438788 [Lactarius hengduanensis]|nr:hypothetical protein EDB84DRAFT_1438788 [Lactarius hengduanensis]
MDEGLNSGKELGEGNIVGADSGEETTRDRNYGSDGFRSALGPLGKRTQGLICQNYAVSHNTIVITWACLILADMDNKDSGPTRASNTVLILRAATLLPHRVLAVSEASGLVIYVQVCNLVEIEAKARQLFGGSDKSAEDTTLAGDRIYCFVQSLYSEEDQLTKEKPAERTVRPTVHARRTPLAGFTTACLGTEGAGDANIALKKKLLGPWPVTTGPWYFRAKQAIVPTGSYEGIDGMTGAEVTDGLARHRQALRRQIGVGEVLDAPQYTYKVPCMRFLRHSFGRCVLVSFGTWPRALERSTEPVPLCVRIEVILDTTHRAGVEVTLHPQDKATVEAITCPPELKGFCIDSLEHDAPFRQPHPDALPSTMVGLRVHSADAFVTVLRDGFACSNDTGVFAHEDNALKLRLMRRWVHVRPRSGYSW